MANLYAIHLNWKQKHSDKSADAVQINHTRTEPESTTPTAKNKTHNSQRLQESMATYDKDSQTIKGRVSKAKEAIR